MATAPAISEYTRLIQRGGYYAEWENANALFNSNLVLAEFEVAVILADNTSAYLGLSLGQATPQATKNLPQNQRKALYGEVLATKVGDGVTPWSKLPYMFPFTEVYYPNKSGRILGTQNTGATHKYLHPADVNKAIFGPGYEAPTANLSFKTGTGFGGVTNTLYRVNSNLTNVTVINTPYANTYPIDQGNIYKDGVRLGNTETAIGGISLPPFEREVSANYVFPYPTNPAYRKAVYTVGFSGDVTDTRPSVEGGPKLANTNNLTLYFTLPSFFGSYDGDYKQLPTDPKMLGEWLTQQLVAQDQTIAEILRQPTNYSPGQIEYGVTGVSPFYAIPKDHGPLTTIMDNFPSDAMVGGAFESPQTGLPFPRTMILTENGIDIEYYVYTTNAPQYNGQIFNYNHY